MSDIAEFTRHLGNYLNPSQVALVERAYHYSAQAHAGQFRKSGEPYITHPLAVASILSEWRLDPEGLTAALLHDVMEDTAVGKEEITREFGSTVAELVDGVSKLDQIEFQSKEEAQAESFRKMLFAMARDFRVILIKLADRLHNMRTLDVMSSQKRRRIAQETLDIYAPLADRLGLYRVYVELEDLAFRQLYPARYRVLSKAIKAAGGNRRESVTRILEAIRNKLSEAGLDATVTGREKSVYSTYRKMLEKHLSFSEVMDIYGCRVIVTNVAACYIAIGALHALYKPIPGKFKDYIAIPKANGYQSLHTTLFGPYGTPIEVQIRTRDMHRVAEAGIAAHWLYKTGGELSLATAQSSTGNWLQRLLDIQSMAGDSGEFLDAVKGDLVTDEVYVFTPKGKILALPRGATAVDFAYAVHTDVGHHCVAARVNHELMPLRTVLRNGDRVEVITSPEAKPHSSWLSWVITSRARTNIRHFLKSLHLKESAEMGERLLTQALQALGASAESVNAEQWARVVKNYRAKSTQDVLADIGLGKRVALAVAQALLSKPDDQMAPSSRQRVSLSGVEGIAVQYAKCCRPIPGDPIVGIMRPGSGLIVHIADCPSLPRLRASLSTDDALGGEIDLWWAEQVTGTFETGIKVIVSHEKGVLAKLAAEIANADANIEHIGMDRPEGSRLMTIHFTISVTGRQHLARVMRRLRRINEVSKLTRTRT